MYNEIRDILKQDQEKTSQFSERVRREVDKTTTELRKNNSAWNESPHVSKWRQTIIDTTYNSKNIVDTTNNTLALNEGYMMNNYTNGFISDITKQMCPYFCNEIRPLGYDCSCGKEGIYIHMTLQKAQELAYGTQQK